MRLVCFVVLLDSVSSHTCPSLEDLHSVLGDVKAHQVNNHEIYVDWSRLWPDINWACAVTVKVIVNGTTSFAVPFSDQKFLAIPVEPCQTLNVIIEAEFDDPNGSEATRVQSVPSLETKTFRPPSGNLNAQNLISLDFVQGNLKSFKLDAKFDDLVLDKECSKVTNVEVVLVKAINGEEINHSSVGTSDFSLVVDITKLLETCTTYNVIARLHGITGIKPVDIHLKTLTTNYNNDIQKAENLEYIYKVENLTVEIIERNQARLNWNKTEGDLIGQTILK